MSHEIVELPAEPPIGTILTDAYGDAHQHKIPGSWFEAGYGDSRSWEELFYDFGPLEILRLGGPMFITSFPAEPS